MKTNILIGCLLIVTLWIRAEEVVTIEGNNSFEESSKNRLVDWRVNEALKERLGKIEIVKGEAQEGEQSIFIKTEKDQVYQLYAGLTSASLKSNIEMTIYVKGKGSFYLGIYAYNSENVFLDIVHNKTIKGDFKEWTKFTFTAKLPTKDNYERGEGPATKFRPAILVGEESELSFDSFSGTVTTPDIENK